MDDLSLLQWPGMAVNVLSVWLLTSKTKGKRHSGFILSLFSNLLWGIWGVYAEALAVLLLQIALATLNVRGARKTETKA